MRAFSISIWQFSMRDVKKQIRCCLPKSKPAECRVCLGVLSAPGAERGASQANMQWATRTRGRCGGEARMAAVAGGRASGRAALGRRAHVASRGGMGTTKSRRAHPVFECRATAEAEKTASLAKVRDLSGARAREVGGAERSSRGGRGSAPPARRARPFPYSSSPTVSQDRAC